jgi:GTP cyclohydrolase I
MFEGRMEGDVFKFFQKVRVQYASYCPCSASLCQHLGENDTFGYPHAQRSYAEVLVEVIPPNIVWLEEIINLVEAAIKTIPYPVIQRVDEQEIARLAAENPIFVEDAIRKICYNLNKHSQIHDWIIKCTHEESIHTSDAIAISWKGIKDGFDGRKYL